MPDISKFLEKAKEIWSKLDNKKKIILGIIAGVIFTAFIIIGSLSSEAGLSTLYTGLEAKDFAEITTKLKEKGYHFKHKGTESIFVNPEEKEEVLMFLAQENLIPKGIPGWELFDMDKWSETQFEKDVKKQRALMGALSRTLSTLKSIEKAQVNIAIPEEELFEEKIQPITAAVILKYAPGVESLKVKEIEGIETLVSRSVPGLKKDNVSIAGPDGKILNDFDDEITREKWELKSVEEKFKIEERQRVKLLVDIRNSLERNYPDRADIVRLDLKMRWDKEEIERSEVEPVIMTPDDPKTPYSERVVKDSLKVSSKKTTEQFEGNGFTPEGPSGTEPNIPPGYKDKDYQKAKYTKKEEIDNNVFNETKRKIAKQPWEVRKINLAVILDGKWIKKGEREDREGYIREYLAVSEEEVRQVSDLLKKAIGYNIARGDNLSVQHIQKDRRKEHEIEDEELRKKKVIRRMLLATLIGLLFIIIAISVYQLIKKEIERRRKLREEELAAQQQMMREAALRAIEDEGIEVEISPEERAKKEMLENVINLVKSRPEDVALLIRTWMSEE